MNKLKDFIIWFAGSLILMVMIWIGIKYSIGFLTFIGILALIFVQIIGVVSLIQLKDDRKQQKVQQNYNEKNITIKEVNDERFGKIIIKYDSNKHECVGEIKNINFNGQVLEAQIDAPDSINIGKMLENLKNFCDRENVMKARIYKELAETIKTGDNFDKDGKLIDITEQFLKEQFKFSFFNMYDEQIVNIWGSWEDSGNQDYAIKYDITKDKFEYELL